MTSDDKRPGGERANENRWIRYDAVEKRHATFPLVNERAIPTLDRKLIVAVAPCGAFVDKQAVPGVPNSPAEIVAVTKECFDAGASFAHIHCKTEDGILTLEADVTIDTLLPIKQACPEIIISGNVADRKEHADRRLFAEPLEEILAKEPDLFDTYTLQTQQRTQWKINEPGLQDQVRYLEDRGIMPELQCPTFQGMINVQRWLIDTGVLRMKPYFVNAHIGKDSIPVTLGEPISAEMTLKAIAMLPPGNIRGVFPCGRNWLPTATIALTQGIDFIRVGFDDAVYMYPHRNEQAVSTAEMVRKVVRIANELGIEIASAAEAREILGLQGTATERARKLSQGSAKARAS
jgi:3-keto-5-aminohexanoate cleavage enzyme